MGDGRSLTGAGTGDDLEVSAAVGDHLLLFGEGVNDFAGMAWVFPPAAALP